MTIVTSPILGTSYLLLYAHEPAVTIPFLPHNMIMEEMRMRNYALTIEDDVITHIADTDLNGTPIPGILHLPKEATAFSPDVWACLGCHADGIEVDAENPVFSSAHNCLLSKDGKTLHKVCKASDISRLTGLETMGRDAFNDIAADRREFVFHIPDGVRVLDYRAFSLCADSAKIIVPASVIFVDLLAFMIHSSRTHIVFEGDAELRIGVFGTAAEAEDSGCDLFRSLPSALYPKADHIRVSCPPGSRISAYCKKYGIPCQTP